VPDDAVLIDTLEQPSARALKILHSYTHTDGETSTAELLRGDAYVLRRPSERESARDRRSRWPSCDDDRERNVGVPRPCNPRADCRDGGTRHWPSRSLTRVPSSARSSSARGSMPNSPQQRFRPMHRRSSIRQSHGRRTRRQPALGIVRHGARSSRSRCCRYGRNRQTALVRWGVLSLRVVRQSSYVVAWRAV